MGFFQCEVNGKPASVYLDMGLKRSMPDKRRHALLAVAIDLLHPHPANGLRAADARPFGLVYETAQSASLAVITQTTGLLTQLSEKNGGQYDGWESPVTGAPARPWWRFGAS